MPRGILLLPPASRLTRDHRHDRHAVCFRQAKGKTVPLTEECLRRDAAGCHRGFSFRLCPSPCASPPDFVVCHSARTNWRERLGRSTPNESLSTENFPSVDDSRPRPARPRRFPLRFRHGAAQGYRIEYDPQIRGLACTIGKRGDVRRQAADRARRAHRPGDATLHPYNAKHFRHRSCANFGRFHDAKTASSGVKSPRHPTRCSQSTGSHTRRNRPHGANKPRWCGWSGRRDSNSRPSVPKTDALPGCATPRRIGS